MIRVQIQCDDCQATCEVCHDLDENAYELIEVCPFCGGDDIEINTREEIL